MTFLFWLFAFLLVYPLVIYPCCLMLLQRIHQYRKPLIPPQDDDLPSVSILLSVYNEEKNIAEKIENFLALDYPQEKVELLIVSDQCTDATEEIILSYTPLESTLSQRIRLLRQETRAGKTQALNRAAAEAHGEIFLFTDADSMLRSDALRRLVTPFTQKAVGLVSGRSVYKDKRGIESTGSLYRQYEEWLKDYEGALYGIAGADGAIYAMRRELYQELPEKIINDLAHPIQVILAGRKALAEPEALVSEPAEDDYNAFARQTRIMAQSWYVFFTYLRPLLRHKRFGFLWQFFTHKILRWLALPWLILFTLTALLTQGCFTSLGLVGACTLFVCAALGDKAKMPGRICRLFLMQSAAGVYGLIHFWQGKNFVTWNPKGE